MAVKFRTDGHKYESIDLFENIEWISVSRLVGRFHEEFLPLPAAEKASKKKTSKWYGLGPQEIVDIWEGEKNRSIILGNWYHDKTEKKLLSSPTFNFKGTEVPVIKPLHEDGFKIAPDQKMIEGIYPEHFVYLKSLGICGQADKPIVINNHLKVRDYKTNKELKVEGFKNWEGVTKKMLPPLLHLDDANLIHYALQLSTYGYIMWKHNPQMIVDNPVIEHITFEVESEDKYGYPITRLDSNGEPIVKGVEEIEVPYLKREVELMFEVIKREREMKNGN